MADDERAGLLQNEEDDEDEIEEPEDFGSDSSEAVDGGEEKRDAKKFDCALPASHSVSLSPSGNCLFVCLSLLLVHLWLLNLINLVSWRWYG
jgi:hypothetical protein